MRRATTTLLISCLLLSACGGIRDSAWNPGNWFGKSRTERRVQTTAPDSANPLIPEERASIFRRKSDEELYEGTPVHTITGLTIERTSGGAIVRASGVPLRQGGHDVRLKALNDGEPVEGVLTYVMEAVQTTNLPQGTQRSRTLNAGRFITDQTLTKVKAIRVLGATNSLSSARR
ncbi:hypothetical protein D6850_09295 [Roseovarius spongiae]|uniref:Lipoprotein n=1 Tax=Roseovarius spongiae TaxID=2320272 RepID=A0A3A8AWG6_9RHOB|nr:hypothetical protein [Roseovarius spongiae]RKF15040.1 hypothetical protein D6850_09295 [Roseovarius spongiae]